MKYIYDIRNAENNKIVFECKEERDAVFSEKCPKKFGLSIACRGTLLNESEMEVCIACWNHAIKCEIEEPKPVIALETILDSCPIVVQ